MPVGVMAHGRAIALAILLPRARLHGWLYTSEMWERSTLSVVSSDSLDMCEPFVELHCLCFQR